MWLDFQSVLTPNMAIDIYRQWTTSDNVLLLKHITQDEAVVILACFHSSSSPISHVTSEALKDQGFWHYNFYGKREQKGDSILLDKLLEYI